MQRQLKTVFTHRGNAKPTEPLAVPIDTAAAMVGVSYNTLWRATRGDQFPAVQIRDRIIIPLKALDEMFGNDEQRETPAASPTRLAVAVVEASAMLSIAPTTLRRAVGENQFPAMRIRERIVIPIKAVHLLLDTAIAAGGLIDSAAWTAEWTASLPPQAAAA